MSGRVAVVTGGAGYLGSHVTAALLERGWSVRALDLLLFGDDGIRSVSNNPSFALLKGSIRDEALVREAVRGADAVADLAAIVGDPACDQNPRAAVLVNVDATAGLLEAARSAGVKRFLFASTCSVYGSRGEEWLDEESLPRPYSLYGVSKLCSEAILLAQQGQGISVAAMRMATLYGLSPRMRLDLVLNILTAHAVRHKRLTVYGGGQWRPIVHVRDAADAFVAALEAPEQRVRGQVFNVGSTGQNYQIADLARQIQGIFPGTELDAKPAPPQTEADRSYRVRCEKIGRATGFRARRTPADGVREIAEWLGGDPGPDYRADRFYNWKYPYREPDAARPG